MFIKNNLFEANILKIFLAMPNKNVVLFNAVHALSELILKSLKDILASDIGINKKSGKNSLKNSDFAKSLEVLTGIEKDSLEFYVVGNYYFYFIEWGRKPNRKMPPYEAILRWAKKNGISTDNNTLYAIRKSIGENGFEARHFVEPTLDKIEKSLDAWADNLFENIISMLDN